MALDKSIRGKKDNSKRRFSGGGPRPDHNEAKRREAKERDAAWNKLSPVQQLKELDKRLGEGEGAKRQRERLQARIEKAKHRPVEQAKAGIKPGEHIIVVAEMGGNIKAKERRAQERKERPAK